MRAPVLRRVVAGLERVSGMLTPVAIADQQDLCHGEGVRVRDCEERRNSTKGGETTRGTAVELQLRRAGSPDNLNAAPQDLRGVSRPERFHGGLFGGESAGKVNRRCATPRAVRDFSFCKHPTQKSLAIPLDGSRDSWNVGGIEPQPDDV